MKELISRLTWILYAIIAWDIVMTFIYIWDLSVLYFKIALTLYFITGLNIIVIGILKKHKVEEMEYPDYYDGNGY